MAVNFRRLKLLSFMELPKVQEGMMLPDWQGLVLGHELFYSVCPKQPPGRFAERLIVGHEGRC